MAVVIHDFEVVPEAPPAPAEEKPSSAQGEPKPSEAQKHAQQLRILNRHRERLLRVRDY